MYARYTADGTEYNSMADDYKNSCREGKSIPVHHNPANPPEVIGRSTSVAVFIPGFGALFVVVDVWTLPRGRAIG